MTKKKNCFLSLSLIHDKNCLNLNYIRENYYYILIDDIQILCRVFFKDFLIILVDIYDWEREIESKREMAVATINWYYNTQKSLEI